MLKISESQSRVLERIDVQIGATTLGFVEGADVSAPMVMGFNKPDHFNGLEELSLQDIIDFAQAVLDYCQRVQGNREITLEQQKEIQARPLTLG